MTKYCWDTIKLHNSRGYFVVDILYYIYLECYNKYNMPSIRTIQNKIETTNEQIRRFLIDIRIALEKINDDTERNARSIGQLRRSIQTKIDKIRSLQEKLARLKEELNRFKNMIQNKKNMFEEEDIRDLTCKDQLLMYSSVLPSILAEVENIIQNI